MCCCRRQRIGRIIKAVNHLKSRQNPSSVCGSEASLTIAALLSNKLKLAILQPASARFSFYPGDLSLGYFSDSIFSMFTGQLQGIAPAVHEKFMNGSYMKYHLTDHSADIGIHVISSTLKALFEDVAMAMFDQITDMNRVDASEKKIIRVCGDDLADLMVNWLREALFCWTGQEMLMKQARVIALSETELEAEVWLEPYHSEKHLLKHEIKAVTYYQIDVKPCSEGWETTIVFDV